MYKLGNCSLVIIFSSFNNIKPLIYLERFIQHRINEIGGRHPGIRVYQGELGNLIKENTIYLGTHEQPQQREKVTYVRCGPLKEVPEQSHPVATD